MTPFPHPHGHSTLDLQVNDKDKDRMIVETTRIVLPADKLAALVAIAGTLNKGCAPGWIEFRGAWDQPDLDVLDRGSNTICESTAIWLGERGLLERDTVPWYSTFRLSSRGKRVVELATGAPD